MSYLVDANVLSEATRHQPDAKVLSWLERHDAELHVSTLTLAEIVKGIHLLAHGKKRRHLEAWFEELVASFAGRVLPVDESVARAWGAFDSLHMRLLLSGSGSVVAKRMRGLGSADSAQRSGIGPGARETYGASRDKSSKRSSISKSILTSQKARSIFTCYSSSIWWKQYIIHSHPLLSLTQAV